jgi:acyl dehydratase
MPGRAISLAEYQSRVGTEIGRSNWIVIDQERINAFADVTLDRQFIHVDPQRAKLTSFGGTVAHGFLTLSLLSVMAQESLPAIEGSTASVNFGMNSLRFVAPVRCDQRVRGRFTLKGMSERSPGVQQLLLAVTVEIDNETKPALVAEWIVLFYL